MRLSMVGGENSQTIRMAAETAAKDLIKANITLHIITWNTYKCNLKIQGNS